MIKSDLTREHKKNLKDENKNSLNTQLTNSQQEIVENNMGLVGHIAKKYQYDYKELFQIGTVGLIKAVLTYDKNKKSKFATYAAVCIENEIRMFFRKEKNITAHHLWIKLFMKKMKVMIEIFMKPQKTELITKRLL